MREVCVGRGVWAWWFCLCPLLVPRVCVCVCMVECLLRLVVMDSVPKSLLHVKGLS